MDASTPRDREDAEALGRASPTASSSLRRRVRSGHTGAIASGAPFAATRSARLGAARPARPPAARESGYSRTSSQSPCRCSVPASRLPPSSLNARSIGSNGSSAREKAVLHRLVHRLGEGDDGMVASEVAPSARYPAHGHPVAVNVPVLSTHRTVTAPSDSTRSPMRARTLRRDRRHAPSARNIVTTTGIWSGGLPSPRSSRRGTLRDALRAPGPRPPRRQGRARRPPSQERAPSGPSRAGETSSPLSIGDEGARRCGPSPWRARRVDEAPAPRAASVPDQTNGRSSPPGRGGASPSPPRASSRERIRPVRSDSSTESDDAWRSLRVGQGRGPLPRSATTSPTRTRPRARGSASRAPPRTTSARGLARSRSASRARSVLPACQRERPTTAPTGGDEDESLLAISEQKIDEGARREEEDHRLKREDLDERARGGRGGARTAARSDRPARDAPPPAVSVRPIATTWESKVRPCRKCVRWCRRIRRPGAPRASMCSEWRPP